MNQLAIRAQILELEAELQRIALGARLNASRRHSNLSWLLLILGSAAGGFVKSRGGWPVALMWAASRLARYWRSRKLKLT
jgi:hypothetical protein